MRLLPDDKDALGGLLPTIPSRLLKKSLAIGIAL
jgi:hypothetical protein